MWNKKHWPSALGSIYNKKKSKFVLTSPPVSLLTLLVLAERILQERNWNKITEHLRHFIWDGKQFAISQEQVWVCTFSRPLTSNVLAQWRTHPNDLFGSLVNHRPYGHLKGQVFFLSLFSCNCNDQLSKNFHRFVIFMHMNWDTPSENELVFDNY